MFSNTFEQKIDLDIIDLKLINPPGKCRDILAIETENGLVRMFCENQSRAKISVVGKKIEIKVASHNPQSSFRLNYKLGEWKFFYLKTNWLKELSPFVDRSPESVGYLQKSLVFVFLFLLFFSFFSILLQAPV